MQDWWSWPSFLIGVLFTPLCFAVWAVTTYAVAHPEKRSNMFWATAFVVVLVFVLGLAAYGLLRIVTG